MISHKLPDCPWFKVGKELFEFKQNSYLVRVDCFSNFIEVNRLEHTKSRGIIHKIKAHFARYGIPDSVVSDNSPQFSSEKFQNFTKSGVSRTYLPPPVTPKVMA